MATMTAAAALATPVAGLAGSSISPNALFLPRFSSIPRNAETHAAFVAGAGRSSVNPLQLGSPVMSRVTCFQRDWLRKDLSVIGFGLIGWLAPSSIPAIDGNSLTGLFFSSIGTELAHWPSGPALTSPFWLWLITWHLGLFIVLTLGQIGFKGRKDAYF